jgi:hypothetical protein
LTIKEESSLVKLPPSRVSVALFMP